MPRRLFQVVLFTDELEETVRFLVEVVGMGEPTWHDQKTAENARFFGWPAEADTDTRRVVLGEGPGVIELVGIPPSMRGHVQPGAAFFAFARPDPEGYASRATEAGFDTGEPMTVDGATLAPVRVGGLPFEFIRFAG